MLVDDWNKQRPNLNVKPGDRIIEISQRKSTARGNAAELLKETEILDCRKKDGQQVLKAGHDHIAMTIIVSRSRPDAKCDPNIRDHTGEPAIKLAARTSPATLKAMLAVDNVDVNAKGALNRTALDSAKEKGNSEMIAMLEARGAKSGG